MKETFTSNSSQHTIGRTKISAVYLQMDKWTSFFLTYRRVLDTAEMWNAFKQASNSMYKHERRNKYVSPDNIV